MGDKALVEGEFIGKLLGLLKEETTSSTLWI